MPSKVWTRAEWVEFCGDENPEARDYLWKIMVDTYKRDHPGRDDCDTPEV